jgi:S1-C subfamily serine protease
VALVNWKIVSIRRTLTTALATVSALIAVAGASAASQRSSATISGIVDVDTNLGYQDAAAAGTGIVLTSSGVILTNNHVIRGATTIRVTDIDNGHTYKAKVVGYLLNGDIAVIQCLNASGLQTAPLGHSSGVKVGNPVTAFGNAGGVGGTPSSAAGKIVGLGKSIVAHDDSDGSEKLTGLLATNAALQPGDSGGPLVNSAGQVIGMDTAAGGTYTYSTSVNRGYAIPIDRALAVANQIVARHGTATIHIGETGFLGFTPGPSADDLISPPFGLTVNTVVPGSPIDRVGIIPGDVLTRFDGKAVNTIATLTALVVTKHPGDAVQVRWVDQYGTGHTAVLHLASGPPQ